MRIRYIGVFNIPVAPVRERGLKFYYVHLDQGVNDGRSRKGAWIEIITLAVNHIAKNGRSRKGAWIEIQQLPTTKRL